MRSDYAYNCGGWKGMLTCQGLSTQNQENVETKRSTRLGSPHLAGHQSNFMSAIKAMCS